MCASVIFDLDKQNKTNISVDAIVRPCHRCYVRRSLPSSPSSSSSFSCFPALRLDVGRRRRRRPSALLSTLLLLLLLLLFLEFSQPCLDLGHSLRVLGGFPKFNEPKKKGVYKEINKWTNTHVHCYAVNERETSLHRRRQVRHNILQTVALPQATTPRVPTSMLI